MQLMLVAPVILVIINDVPEFITATALKENSIRLNPIDAVLIAMYGAAIGKVGILNIESILLSDCLRMLIF